MTKPELWISSWIALFDALSGILTFGYWIPCYEMNWMSYCTIKECEKRIKQRDRENTLTN